MTSVLAATYTTCHFPGFDQTDVQKCTLFAFSLCYRLLEFPELERARAVVSVSLFQSPVIRPLDANCRRHLQHLHSLPCGNLHVAVALRSETFIILFTVLTYNNHMNATFLEKKDRRHVYNEARSAVAVVSLSLLTQHDTIHQIDL